ncbi:unnamed protein product [Clavelina lepadiformis]|uniref:GDP-Man:Man(3)GlcNAc(2)-PP-Dol alpha-1,2-mannosyltransferase n=1 Tax=Clavelina lepadiformis TaxID=159417 RepID=A0ABP0F682_CLALP
MRIKHISHHQKERVETLQVKFRGGIGPWPLSRTQSSWGTFPSAFCVVYTGDLNASSTEIVGKAKKTFGISLPREIKVVFLKRRNWVNAARYPFFTLLGQSLGSVFLGMEALLLYPPDIFLDTMGYAFTLPMFKYIAGCRTGCYVHYPTISTDMLTVVEGQTDAFNNRPIIARSRVLTFLKLMYYRMFACIYGMFGRSAEAVMVNSSWTYDHIKSLWRKDVIQKVYPPCNIHGFLNIPVKRAISEKYQNIILSIGQFRPEKNHALQIQSFHDFLLHVMENNKSDYTLVLVGGCRNEDDKRRVNELKKLAADLKVANQVVFKTNVSYEELKELLSQAHVGIHTMANEHFGIGVVEFQAASVIALAHNSGGPKMDIIQEDDGTGFLANDVDSYSKELHHIFSLPAAERDKIVQKAKLSCKRFSEEHFEETFLTSISHLFGESAKNR